MDNPYPFLIAIILIIPALVIVVPRWIRSRERQRILDKVMLAAEKGISLPENVIQALIRAAAGSGRPIHPDPVRDMRRGVFMVAVGGGLVVVGLAVLATFFRTEAAGVGFVIAAVGVIPLCIGVGYVIVARLGERAQKSVIE